MYQEENEEYSGPVRPPHRHRPPEDEGGSNRLLRLRNILNIIFMLGAVIGVGFYLAADKQTGIYIILGAMAFKIVESALRLLRH